MFASSDHQATIVVMSINRLFVAETALMQAEKSLIDKMMGPLMHRERNRSGRFIPVNASIDEDGPTQTPCYRSFRNLSRADNFRVVEQIQNQSF